MQLESLGALVDTEAASGAARRARVKRGSFGACELCLWGGGVRVKRGLTFMYVRVRWRSLFPGFAAAQLSDIARMMGCRNVISCARLSEVPHLHVSQTGHTTRAHAQNCTRIGRMARFFIK